MENKMHKLHEIVKGYIESDMIDMDPTSYSDMATIHFTILNCMDEYISGCEKFIAHHHPDINIEEMKNNPKSPKSYQFFTMRVKTELIKWYAYFMNNSPHKDLFE